MRLFVAKFPCNPDQTRCQQSDRHRFGDRRWILKFERHAVKGIKRETVKGCPKRISERCQSLTTDLRRKHLGKARSVVGLAANDVTSQLERDHKHQVRRTNRQRYGRRTYVESTEKPDVVERHAVDGGISATQAIAGKETTRKYVHPADTWRTSCRWRITSLTVSDSCNRKVLACDVISQPRGIINRGRTACNNQRICINRGRNHQH